MADAQFTGRHLFHVDRGELDGLTPAECFTLGVEWEMVRQAGNRPERHSRPVRDRNRDRLAKLLTELGRGHRFTHLHDDASESWLWLEIDPTE